ncbi:hypothetical protein MTF68_07290 [Pseudoalteromonas sp. 2CM37A]|uniref:hypothetical protein n=1 Tax=Pseudoalteromonas sp. 2CM37A TaxID=2929853 RepID=UPI0020C09FFD|nr:hypothetical protein [Pseudoalteromonas sp. 2CM37A]MCK8117362.1 hypothetical protein [Pseudoalteromonas sp. 2CM37A]
MSFSINNLPYNLPSNLNEQLRILANIVDIPYSFVKDGGEDEVEAICGAMLYRHLDRHQRMEVMTKIRALSNRALTGKLISVAIEPTFINKDLGIWSFTEEELLADKYFHSQIDTFASYVGVGASVLSGKDLLKQVWKQRKITRGGVVTLVIWGTVLFNKSELAKVNDEIKRRSSIRTISLKPVQ